MPMSRDDFIAYTQRTDITHEELPQWFATVCDFLQAAYVTADTPWQQSGKGSSYEEWVRLRVPLAELITTDGTFLDVGCANGFLLDCLLQWTSAKKHHTYPSWLRYWGPTDCAGTKTLATIRR